MPEDTQDIRYLETEEMLHLLEMYRSELPQRRQTAQNYTALYISLLSVIIGGSVAGASLVTQFPRNLFVAVGPILALFICHYTRDTVRRQDAHIREVIAMIAKAEDALGLHGKVKVRGVDRSPELWPDDDAFVIDRWVKSRMKSGASSENFIAQEGTGTFKNLRRVFTAIEVISVLLFVGILLAPFIF
jgi:hypothetical protein